MDRINLKTWISTESFESAISFSDQYRYILGVDEIRKKILENYQRFGEEVSAIVEQEQPIIDDSYNAWEIVNNKKNIWKWASVGSLIFSIIILLIGTSNLFLTLIFLVLLFGFLVGIIVTFGYVIKTKILENRYCSYISSCECKFRQVLQKYEAEIPALRKQIDNLYLNSLEPSVRIQELARRDQERQHQEIMRMHQEAQQQQLQIMQQMQQQMQQQMLQQGEEQRKSRKAQEELLRIEREREDRYYRGY